MSLATENENHFRSFEPCLKQTGIFIDRFFNRFSYSDLAVKYDMSKETAIKTFYNGQNRILDAIKAMDTAEVPSKKVGFYKKTVKKRSGSLPKGQKWFLFNKLFRLRPYEIAEMEGIDNQKSSVRQLIFRTSD